MVPGQTRLRQGILDMLIRKALTIEKMHGLGISHRIAEVTIC
ncbi:MAG TPA: hypothetical protein VHM93_10800 [Candidatus Acidoferrum sp.]|nr:hypothetical protein [Candidatus Acidoferrum sp.]